jgi:hypothetical protein
MNTDTTNNKPEVPMDYTDNAYEAFLSLEYIINQDFELRGESDFPDRLDEVTDGFGLTYEEIEQVKWLYDNQVY